MISIIPYRVQHFHEGFFACSGLMLNFLWIFGVYVAMKKQWRKYWKRTILLAAIQPVYIFFFIIYLIRYEQCRRSKMCDDYDDCRNNVRKGIDGRRGLGHPIFGQEHFCSTNMSVAPCYDPFDLAQGGDGLPYIPCIEAGLNRSDVCFGAESRNYTAFQCPRQCVQLSWICEVSK